MERRSELTAQRADEDRHSWREGQLELGLVLLLMLSMGLIINFDAFVIINTVDRQR